MSLMLQQAPITSALCDEPEGLVQRAVYPMPIDLAALGKFWDKASKFKTIFTDEITDFKAFCELFISDEGGQLRAHGLFWRIDDFVGMYYLTHLTTVDAHVHYTFFDRRHKGREELTKKMIEYVFRRFGFERLTAEVPVYASRHTFGFTFALGFKKEGTKRKGARHKGQWFDVVTFGLLREEVIDGN